MLGQREVGGLDLQRGAQLVEGDDRVGVQPGDARAAVGDDVDEALVLERAQRGPDGVAGGAVVVDEVAFDEAGARVERAVEDALAQLRGDAVDGGRGGALGGGRGGAGAVIVMRGPRPAWGAGARAGRRARRGRPG